MERVTCSVEHRKIHARDCEDCETVEGKVDEFVRSIAIEGDVEASVRERMVEIADRCPVHRTLHGEVRIRTALTAPEETGA